MAFLLRLTVQKQGASVSISKFNYYFVIITNSFKRQEDTSLPGTPCKAQPPLTFIRLVDKVEEPLSLGFELGVAVLVGVVQHAQPAVRGLQLVLGGLWKPPKMSSGTANAISKRPLSRSALKGKSVSCYIALLWPKIKNGLLLHL